MKSSTASKAVTKKAAKPVKPIKAPLPPKPDRIKPINHHRIPPADDGSVRVVKVGRCHSMSGRSELTYHVGATAEGEVMFRIHANSAAGFFSQEWVSLKDVETALASKQDTGAITSFLLHNLFKGKSVNTPAFLLAALKTEGMVQPSATVKRCFERTDESAFAARMKALVNATSDMVVKGATPKNRSIPAKAASGGTSVIKTPVSPKKKTPSVSRK